MEDFSSVSTLAGQMAQCANSYSDVVKILSAHSANDQLITARFGLVDTILMLNEMKYNFEEVSSRNIPHNSPGCLLLAPRWFEGQMCLDSAIVVDPPEKRGEYGEEDVTQTGSTSGATEGECITVSWVRPLSKYELVSRGSTFSINQLKSGSHVTEYCRWQKVFSNSP
jgi:hypothetical protein